MTWPTADVTTTSLDAGTDSPQTARAHLLDLAQKFNQMRAHGAVFEQGLAAGVYTPSVSGLVNISSAPVHTAYYTQIGSIVTVELNVQATISAAGVASFLVSLPVARAFGAGEAAVATGAGVAWGNTSLVPVGVSAYPTTSLVQVLCRATAAGLHGIKVSFTYQVV